MDKLFRKGFGFLKSCTQLIRIIIVFCILMLIFQWIQDLIGTNWEWTNFIKPLLTVFISLGESISDNSLNVFGAVFEYKYFFALIIMLVLLFIFSKSENLIAILEDKYDDGHRLIKKIAEDKMNSSMEQTEHLTQKKIKEYKVYIETSIKKQFSHAEQGINLHEQNKIMNKFLMENTRVSPIVYREGFLYSFSRFERIDDVLKILFKLIKSKSPLNYCICVQVIENNETANSNLDKLIDLKFENKICMMSDTAYRYKHNDFHGYGTSSLGIFQKDGDTCEAHEFIEIL